METITKDGKWVIDIYRCRFLNSWLNYDLYIDDNKLKMHFLDPRAATIILNEGLRSIIQNKNIKFNTKLILRSLKKAEKEEKSTKPDKKQKIDMMIIDLKSAILLITSRENG